MGEPEELKKTAREHALKKLFLNKRSALSKSHSLPEDTGLVHYGT